MTGLPGEGTAEGLARLPPEMSYAFFVSHVLPPHGR
jgi:hypothetical protein